MYRHAAESIKENSLKRFITRAEKDKFDSYETTLRSKEDSYNKTELDEKIKEICDINYTEVTSSYISEQDTLMGSITEIEVFGNTVQNTEDLSDIQSVGEPQDDGTYKLSLKSCGKNIVDAYSNVSNKFISDVGNLLDNDAWRITNDYFNIKENTEYIISETNVGNYMQYTIAFYDINLNFIKVIALQRENKFTTPVGAKYFKFAYSVIVGNIDIVRSNLQIEEGTLATEYEPYNESSVDIKLPCHLERLFNIDRYNVHDKLFKRNDGVWCIEKTVATKEINSENYSIVHWHSNPSLPEGYLSFIIQDCVRSCKQYENIISNRTPNGIANWTIGNNMFINEYVDLVFILRSEELTDNTVDSFKKWLDSEKTIIKYHTPNPEIIELPLDTQITLNSYFGRTNVFSDNTVIQPNIKVKIPKSITGSLESLVERTDEISDRIKKIETLEEGESISHKSSNGTVNLINSEKGFAHDLKIEGETLFNVLGTPTVLKRTVYDEKTNSFIMTQTGSLRSQIEWSTNSCAVVGKTYTLYMNITKNTLKRIDSPTTRNVLKFNITSPSYDNLYVREGFVGKIINVYTPRQKDSDTYAETFDDKTIGEIIIKDLMLIEGDHSDKSPEFFEGLSSIGQSNNLELISYKPSDIKHIIPIRVGSNDNSVFNFRVSGISNFKWLYSDGTVSTELQQNKALYREEIVYLLIYDEDISKLCLENLKTTKNLIMDLSDLQGNTFNTLSLIACPNITGDLSDLQGKVNHTLRIDTCPNITGDLSDLQGNVTYHLNLGNCPKITGKLSDLQGKISYYLNLVGCGKITGDLSDLGGNVSYYLNLYNCPNITGDLSDLGGKLTDVLCLYNCANITGSLSDLGGKLSNYLNLGNCVNVTGNLSDLGGKLSNHLNLYNCKQVLGVYTPQQGSTIKALYLHNTGQTTDDVDNTLIAVANNTTTTDGVIETNGRSSASDSAVNTLKSRGWTIKCNGVLQ